MNEHLRQSREHRTTQAAEGLPRWRWTTAELVHLTELGAFRDEDRFELIGGEIVPMSPVGRRHEVVAEVLERYLRARETTAVHVVKEPQFNLADDAYTKPDIVVRPAGIQSYDLRGDTVLLVIEVAVSSLDYDLDAKARLYATHGVREYWVVDAEALVTTIHRGPVNGGYAEKQQARPGQLLTPLLVPALTIRMADLKLD